MKASTPVLAIVSFTTAITAFFLQAHASESCGGVRCSSTSPITITNSEMLTEQAGAACKRTFGAAAAVRRIDRAKKFIYCADGNNDNDVMRIKFRFGAPKPKQPLPKVVPVFPPPTEDTSISNSGTLPAGTPPVEPPTVTTQPATQHNGRFPKGALQFCMSKYGPSSTVNHIDYEKWEVVCNIP